MLSCFVSHLSQNSSPPTLKKKKGKKGCYDKNLIKRIHASESCFSLLRQYDLNDIWLMFKEFLPVDVWCSFLLQKDEFAIADYALVHTCKKMIRVSTCAVMTCIFVCILITACPHPPLLPCRSPCVCVCVCVCFAYLSLLEYCLLVLQWLFWFLFCRNTVTQHPQNQTFWTVWRKRKTTMTLTTNVGVSSYSARSHRPEVSNSWKTVQFGHWSPPPTTGKLFTWSAETLPHHWKTVHLGHWDPSPPLNCSVGPMTPSPTTRKLFSWVT